MATDLKVDIRPRSLGELLDDAIRLSLAEAPLLLALSGLFLIPASIALLLLLALPLGDGPWLPILLASLTALLLPMTGLGSGACQELFHGRANDKTVSLSASLRAALRTGLVHVTARAVTLVGVIVGLAFLVVPGLCVWLLTSAVHPLLVSGLTRLGRALAESAREAQRNPGKSVVVGLARLGALLFTVLNLYILIEVALWIAGNLAGFDTGLLNVALGLSNPAYAACLFLLAWWFLAPFGEACNYLLHIDTRVRYEGLDLWYRVQRLFPEVQRSKAILLLAFCALLLCSAGTLAEEPRLEAVRKARQEVRAVRGEVRVAEPYPGGARWKPQLQTALDSLKKDGKAKRPERFDKLLDQFAKRDRRGALETLNTLDDQLGLIEDSYTADVANGEDARRLLGPEEARKLLPERETERKKENKKKEPPDPKKEETVEIETRGGRGPGIMVPAGAGFSGLGWLILGGLLLACVVVAIILFVQQRRAEPKVEKSKETGATLPTPESLLAEPDEHTAMALWQQADELAGQGQFLEAVRRLYLAVLAMLHRSHLIRYEKTRTNGEYLRQVRLTPEAPANVHACFNQLTRTFDRKWYGDRGCDAAEYGDCRAMAEQLRSDVKA
jgi:hypothetical protein